MKRNPAQVRGTFLNHLSFRAPTIEYLAQFVREIEVNTNEVEEVALQMTQRQPFPS